MFSPRGNQPVFGMYMPACLHSGFTLREVPVLVLGTSSLGPRDVKPWSSGRQALVLETSILCPREALFAYVRGSFEERALQTSSIFQDYVGKNEKKILPLHDEMLLIGALYGVANMYCLE